VLGAWQMEKYNRVYFALWALFSVMVFFITLVSVLNQLGEWVDNIFLSFFLLILFSELLGFGLASLVINRIFANIYNPWNPVHYLVSHNNSRAPRT
jgi:glucan phosphoethanolaminetransferase (alkaline phosphatase superfamily)